MKFDLHYTPTIMDGAVLRWQFGYVCGKHHDLIDPKERTEWSGEINASRNGVSINGRFPIYADRECIDQIHKMLDDAWAAHARMRHGDSHEIAKQIVAEALARKEG